uniref:Growth hormone inducible transmembrane protein n=1 Tax=Naja naja TaxID=35670 RepID=A0A8C6X547_NAJNA
MSNPGCLQGSPVAVWDLCWLFPALQALPRAAFSEGLEEEAAARMAPGGGRGVPGCSGLKGLAGPGMIPPPPFPSLRVPACDCRWSSTYNSSSSDRSEFPQFWKNQHDRFPYSRCSGPWGHRIKIQMLGNWIWPQYVKDRIRSTYMYFAGSVGLTALSAVAVSRTPALMGLMMKGSWLAIGTTFAAMIGAGMLVRSIDYEESPFPKHAAWMLHAGVMGAVVAPLTLLGGPLLIRAAWYTAGIVGGLSAVAMCAPSEKFLNMGAPLGLGLGLVLVSSVGSMFLPPTSVLGAGMYSVAIYGGLVLFSLFLLHDTQHVIRRAENQPYQVVGVRKYDPINACMGIYMDTLNIFIRVATMLAGGGGRKK